MECCRSRHLLIRTHAHCSQYFSVSALLSRDMCCGATLWAGIDAHVRPSPPCVLTSCPHYPSPPAADQLSTYPLPPRRPRSTQPPPVPSLCRLPRVSRAHARGWEAKTAPETQSDRGSNKRQESPRRSLLLRRVHVLQGWRRRRLRRCGGRRSVQRVHKVGEYGRYRVRGEGTNSAEGAERGVQGVLRGACWGGTDTGTELQRESGERLHLRAFRLE